MKRILLLFFCCGILKFSYSQSALHKKADKYFSHFEYAAATAAYEELILTDSSNSKVMERLAMSYIKLNYPEKAVVWLSKLCRRSQPEANHLKLYAQALAANGQYATSVQWYKKYLNLVPDDHANGILAGYTSINAFYKDSSFYRIEYLPINTQHSDFSPAFYHDGIVFCSARGKSKSTFAWDNSSFIDLYWSKENIPQPVDFGKPVNSDLHEGPSSFSPGYDTLYFTRNSNRNATGGDGIVKLKIFYTVLKNGVWQKEQSLSLNSDTYSTGHPALAPDHKLYFVSDMPSGFGGTDIYYTKLENGRWSSPVNLGPTINTPGNEMFPFVDELGDLYFASNTHPGLGGLDIFYAKAQNTEFIAPKNLGYPINSSKDDFGLIIKNKQGFFTSNRGSNPKDDNIYSFIIDKTRSLTIRAVTVNGKPLEDFKLVISNGQASSEKIVAKTLTNIFNCEEAYTIQYSKDGYKAGSLTLTHDDLTRFANSDTLKIKLADAIKQIKIELQSSEGKKLVGGTIDVKNKVTGERQKISLKDGALAITVNEAHQYEITASKTNYRNKTVTLLSEDFVRLNDNEPLHIVLTPLNAMFENNDIGEIIELEIRYDVNKYTIRPDAAKELDKLVTFLKKNTSVKVELGSHTDARGSDEANFKLSQKRAESAVQYIVAKGINSNRLIPVGYGESDLKVKNAASEDDHQHNRRTTVKIVGN